MRANYHTHTTRCNHAVGSEREYIETAIQSGIKVLGFSDHTPYPFGEEYSAYIRMEMHELEEYVTTILNLKKEYQKDIQIHVGLEVEYYENFFEEMYREIEQYPLEYLLLAAHWSGDSKLKTEPYFGIYTEDEKIVENYYHQMISGMEKGCFAYVAHPDLLHYPLDKPLYGETMRKICRKANECNLPLEINLRGIRTGKQYPNPVFWKIAGEEKCKVIIGCDAHEPDELIIGEAYQKALQYVEDYQLQLIDEIRMKKS